jgi:hypothetical protein
MSSPKSIGSSKSSKRKAKSETKGKAFIGVTALAESQASHAL